MKKIYFVRHGESEGNAIRIHQSKDTPLSEIGQSQAKIVALRFAKIETSLIIASPYLRARQTAQAIADRNKLKVETSEFFAERRGPSELVGISHNSEQSKQIRKELGEHLLDQDGTWIYSDEENAVEFAKRAEAALEFLKQRPEENITVVCHALIIRMIFTKILNPHGDLKNLYDIYESFDLNNTGISVATYDSEKQRWQMNCINDYSHLG
jgi:broad specificity phosphatase PhoE